MKQITKAPAKNKTYVGYCCYPAHRGYVTRKILQEHNCCNKPIYNELTGQTEIKECPHFRKYEHQYWRDKEQSRILRKAKKLAQNSRLTDRDIKKLCVKHNWDEAIIMSQLNVLLKGGKLYGLY